MKVIQNIDQVEIILRESKVEVKDRLIFNRFWNKVNIKDNIEDCWDWKASTNMNGYGLFYFGKVMGAHRVAYILTKGSIPDGLQVQHLCNNKKCCNPNHLELGDNSDNAIYLYRCSVQDGTVESIGNTILTADNVREIHRIYECTGKPRRLNWQFTEPIAQKFGIGKHQVGEIIRGKQWRHIYEEFNGKK